MFYLNCKFTVISGYRNLPSTKVPKDRKTMLKHAAVKNRPAMFGYTDRSRGMMEVIRADFWRRVRFVELHSRVNILTCCEPMYT